MKWNKIYENNATTHWIRIFFERVAHLADVVNEEVALLREDHGGVYLLLGEQIKPHSESVHHGQEKHPQELQYVQNPLHYITASGLRCCKIRMMHWDVF